MKRHIESMVKRMFRGLICSLLLLSFTSCDNESSEAAGPPVITSVTKTTDPDSTFTRSFPGQMIVVTGENFTGLKQIYFNEQKVAFNPNYVMDKSVIVTIPEDIPLKGSNPDLPNEIRIVTSKGEARFNFQFLSPAPTISLLYYNLPSKAGDPLLIIGANFYEVEKVVFHSEQGDVDAAAFTVNNSYTQISLTIPAEALYDGAIEVHCVTDMVSKEFKPTATPIIRSINSDMPVIGTRVSISGEYFFGIEKIVLPGGKEITDFTINSTNSEISFTMPNEIPSQGGKLQLKTKDATYDSPHTFYPVENIIADLDTKGWYSWGDHNVIATATPASAPYHSNEKYISIFGTPGAYQYWWGNIVMGCSGWPGNIADNTSTGNLVLRFSFYTEFPLDKGYFQTQMGSRWHDAVPVSLNPEWRPYQNSAGAEVGSQPGKWVDYEIPIPDFGTDLKTYADVKKLTGEIGFFFKNATEDDKLVLNTFFDNFRIIDKTK